MKLRAPMTFAIRFLGIATLLLLLDYQGLIFQVWSWTRDFPVSATRVVILGQDPYHGPGQAHGLCFSVQKGTKIPPSLVNMYKELGDDQNINFKHPGHGFLQGECAF